MESSFPILILLLIVIILPVGFRAIRVQDIMDVFCGAYSSEVARIRQSGRALRIAKCGLLSLIDEFTNYTKKLLGRIGFFLNPLFRVSRGFAPLRSPKSAIVSRP